VAPLGSSLVVVEWGAHVVGLWCYDGWMLLNELQKEGS
jgi:hypothetical protein